MSAVSLTEAHMEMAPKWLAKPRAKAQSVTNEDPVIHFPHSGSSNLGPTTLWVVVNIAVPFWVLIKIRHLALKGPKRAP